MREVLLYRHNYSVQHRRRIETESKAKCRRFGLGVKIECRTRKSWCECVALCTWCCTFSLCFCGGGDILCRFVFRVFIQKQQKVLDLMNA